MPQIPIHNTEGERLDTLEVDAALFGGQVRRRLLHDVVVAYEANRRVGTASTLQRGEVSYSRRKPWRQKHTGRARTGDRRNPIWRKGGTTFGPKPRAYSKTIPRRMKRAAFDSAFLAKLLDGEVLGIDRLELPEPKTRELAAILKAIGIERSCLIGISEYDRNLWLSCRNLPRTRLLPFRELNAHLLLRYHNLLFTRGVLEALLQERRERLEGTGLPEAETGGSEEDGCQDIASTSTSTSTSTIEEDTH